MNKMDSQEKIKSGLFLFEGDLETPLPLEFTHYSGVVNGRVARILVEQRFGNPLQEPVELEYLFPIPQDAEVSGFEIKIGQRVVSGELEELEKARETYQEAVDSGKRSGLLEQRRPNLFGLKLGNVLPGESILTLIHYQQRVQFEENRYELVIPMGITPKYSSPEHPEELSGVDVRHSKPGEKIGTVEIMLSLDGGAPIQDPSSPSHSLSITRIDERRMLVQLSEREIPDHDFVLRYALTNPDPVMGCWTSHVKAGNLFYASLFPPQLEELPQPGKREFVFVLDRSGSMGGEPIAQARNALRACLRSLNHGDQFYILLFDDMLEWYRTQAEVISQDAIDRCDSFLAGVEGRGGTEIIPALQAALELPKETGLMRFVVFLTDGAVTAEARTLEMIRKKLGNARVFTFGIGPSVNRALLSRIARLGRGAVEFLQADEDIEEAIIRFQDRISFPVLTDIKLQCEQGKIWDVYPSISPDLYLGQPIEFCGWYQSSGNKKPKLVVEANRGTERIRIPVNLETAKTEEPSLIKTWARFKIEDLEEQSGIGQIRPNQARQEIIQLSLEHKISSAYTAFVAVDQQPAVNGNKLQKIVVSQPVPRGLERDAFDPLVSGNVAQPGGFQRLVFSASAPQSAGAVNPMAMPASFPVPPSPKRSRSAPTTGALPPMDGMVYQVNDSVVSSEELRRLSDVTKSINDREQTEILAGIKNKEDFLRWLVRSQSLNGSWEEDVEKTALGLLAFVREGYTHQHGPYRKSIQRAFEWLSKISGSGSALFLRALVLSEFARLTVNPHHQSLSKTVIDELPAPANELEFQILQKIFQKDEVDLKLIDSAEKLKSAVIAGLKIPIKLPLEDQVQFIHWLAVLGARVE